MILIFVFSFFQILSAQEDKINISAGPGIIYSSSIYKSKKDRIIPIPFISLKYDKLSLNGIRASYNYLQTAKTNFFLSLSFKPSGFDPADGYYLKDMKKRRDNFFVSNSLKYDAKRFFYSFEFSYDLVSTKPSYIVGAEVSKTKRLKKGLLTLSFKLEYENDNLSNLNYGVFAYESKPWRAEYLPKAVILPSINLSLLSFKAQNQTIFLFSSLKYLPGKITKSPIIDKKYNFILVLGYLFKL